MGTAERMDCEHNTVIVYTAQPDEIVEKLMEQGHHYAKLALIASKYGDSKDVFLQQASQIVEKDPAAESAIWTFLNPEYVERYPRNTVLTLRVPINQAVFFRMSDWNKILNLRYIGETQQEEKAFDERLANYGVKYEGDIYTTPFYPMLKKELLQSWARLFRYDAPVKLGVDVPYSDLQAGLWSIERQWIVQ